MDSRFETQALSPFNKIHFCGLHLSEWTQGLWTKGSLETNPPFWVNMGLLLPCSQIDSWWLEGSRCPHGILQNSWFSLNRRTNTNVFWKPKIFSLVYHKQSNSIALKGLCDNLSAHSVSGGSHVRGLALWGTASRSEWFPSEFWEAWGLKWRKAMWLQSKGILKRELSFITLSQLLIGYCFNLKKEEKFHREKIGKRKKKPLLLPSQGIKKLFSIKWWEWIKWYCIPGLANDSMCTACFCK